MTDIDIRLTVARDLSVLNELDHVARVDPARRSLIEAATFARRAWTMEVSSDIVGYGIISH